MEIAAILHGVGSEKSNLIKALQLIQMKLGFVSDEALEGVATFFQVPIVDVEGVVSFYAQFKRKKPGKFVISICDGTACHIKGATLVSGWISDELGISSGETDGAELFSLETVACLGCCSLAPVISVNGKIFGNLTRRQLIKITKQYRREAVG